MGTIKVHEFITLDGVIENPAGWSFDFPFDPRMGEAIGGIMSSCRAILLGRKTWEMFAPAWSARGAEEPGAPFMNDSPKYVVSASNPTVEWRNSTVIGGYDKNAIRELKASVDGGIYVSGSGVLVRALLADGLVDELHLFTYPVTLGAGQRLFEDGPALKLSLSESDTYSSGCLHLVYAPA